MLVEACPNEKDPGLLVLEAAPKTFVLVDVGAEETDWPKTGAELKPGWLKEKPLAGLVVACPKAGACPNVVCPKAAGAEAPNAGLPNPELLAWGAAVAVLLAATCPNTGVAEGTVAVLLESWLNAELELAAGGCVKTEEPEVAVPKTAVSVAEAGGALLEAVLEVLGVPEASMTAEPASVRGAATITACPGPAKVEAGDTASVLLSGPPGATGVASVDAIKLAADAGGVELLSGVCTRTGSFLTESGVCREAWGG